jgi:hypothetical protein
VIAEAFQAFDEVALDHSGGGAVEVLRAEVGVVDRARKQLVGGDEDLVGKRECRALGSSSGLETPVLLFEEAAPLMGACPAAMAAE